MKEQNKYLLPDIFTHNFSMKLSFDSKFHTVSIVKGNEIDIYTKNIIIEANNIAYIQFVNNITFLLNEFEDKIVLSKINGISFDESINDLIIDLIEKSTEEGNIIEENNKIFIWKISEKQLILLLSSSFHQMGYNCQHIHICRDQPIEIYCETNNYKFSN